eukprot:TRINITY_DN9731_c0_g1_i4.p2 TRINITY_DN9731_c0_g1~~TRINITY_DN9731_c0_g1_i4.p2  ORF type:complete len:104 (-),score=6.13 TRINITY_DN9731_c0_g1_i4:176-487(-)
MPATRILPINEDVKPTGCMCPFHPAQILSYIVFALDGYAFYFVTVVAWSKTPTLVWPFAIPYTAMFIAIVVLTLVVTFSDPTDPTVYMERLMKLNGYSALIIP